MKDGIINQDIKEKFMELRAGGATFRAISKELHIPETQLIEWSRELKEDIANLKVIVLEDDEAGMFTKRSKRVNLMNSLVEKIKVELDKRDLSTVPTEKLIAILPRLTDSLKNDYREVIFTKTINSDYAEISFGTSTINQWKA